MDAKKFIRELVRMCKSQDETCSDCQIFQAGCPLFVPEYADADVLVDVVEKWSKEHPVMTNGRRFLDKHKEHIIDWERVSVDEYPYIDVTITPDWWDAEYEEGRKHE